MLLAVLLLQYKYLALLESPYKTTHFPWPPQKVAVLCKPLPNSQYIPRSLSPWYICWMSAKKTLKITGTCFWFTTPSYCCILINSEVKKRTHLALRMSNREEFSADDSMYSLHPHREYATGGKLVGTGTNEYKLAFVEFRQETMYVCSIKTVRSKDSLQQEYCDNFLPTLDSF